MLLFVKYHSVKAAMKKTLKPKTIMPMLSGFGVFGCLRPAASIARAPIVNRMPKTIYQAYI